MKVELNPTYDIAQIWDRKTQIRIAIKAKIISTPIF
jgi:hypothetical protein